MNSTQGDNDTNGNPQRGDGNVESDESSSSTALYTFEQASSSASDVSGTAERGKKRKRSVSRISNRKIRRLQSFYNARYHDLLNHTINEIQSNAGLNDSKLYDSQVGITIWNRQEKECLFRGLSRHGRDGLQNIAARIGSKSEPEVRVYLQTLGKASKEQHAYGDTSTVMDLAAIPSAVEISQRGCAVLEQAADSLAVLQRKHEEQSEKLKHADLWILNHETVDWLAQSLHEDEASKAEVYGKLPAAELLHLKHFLALSEEIFMNSTDPERDWRTFTARYERPSMLFTAFADFGELATSITKRLIQSSLFFAMSRLRASEPASYNHQRVVKRGDVLTALNVVGMKPNAREWWANVARRCKLNVYSDSKAIASGHPMSYSAVERSLMPDDVKDDEQPSPPATVVKGYQDLDLDEQSNHSAFSDTTSLMSSDSSDTKSDSSSDPESNSDEQSDAYLEYIDHRASRKEELRLWKMLGRNPPQELQAENPRKVANSRSRGQDKTDLEDWRQWLDFKPEWEAYDLEDLDGDLIQNRTIMRSKVDSHTEFATRAEAKEHSHSDDKKVSSTSMQQYGTPEHFSSSASDSPSIGESHNSRRGSSIDAMSEDENVGQRDFDHVPSADGSRPLHMDPTDSESDFDQQEDGISATDANSPLSNEDVPRSVSSSSSADEDDDGNQISDADARGQDRLLDQIMESGSGSDEGGSD
ncbi:MAG: hypothetical protein Q9220_003679 [cf. Caloplaca sp. 1 TL-2023]